MKTEIRKRLAQLEKEGKTIDYQLGFLEGALFAIDEADRILTSSEWEIPHSLEVG
jgi:hypothetical protein